MKNNLILFLFFCICNFFANAEKPSHLVVTCRDGSKITYSISDEPKITFNESLMVINSTSLNVEHSLNSIEQITYENINNSSTEKLLTDATSFNLENNILKVFNDSADIYVNIYDATGKCVLNSYFHKSESGSIYLNDLEKGLYILTINNYSFKFLVR